MDTKISDQLKIYEQIGFSIEKAQVLIAMVRKSVDEFFECQQFSLYEEWSENQGNSLKINTKEYDVLARFAVDEYWYGVNELLNINFQDLFTGDPQRAVRTRVPFGFILRSKSSDNEIYIAIRGTQTKPEWFNNLAFKPEEKPFLDSRDLGKVHGGFYHIYKKDNVGRRIDPEDDLDPIQKVIEDTIESKCQPESKVYVVGHSLGAALATMAAAHIRFLNYFSEPPTLYTFASPRVGNEKFAQYIEQNLNAYRVINSEDIISAVPLASARLTPKKEIEKVLVEDFKEVSGFLSGVTSLLPDLDFYHVGKVIPFTVHKGSILENHIAATYEEALIL